MKRRRHFAVSVRSEPSSMALGVSTGTLAMGAGTLFRHWNAPRTFNAPMDCREFRRNHVSFVDDLLPGIDLVRMQRHVLECEACARHDTMVRRALLVVRNVPRIEPSADFSERLHARIRALNIDPTSRSDVRLHARVGLGTFAAAATGVMAAGLLTFAVASHTGTVSRDLVLPPVVASLPADEFEDAPSPIPAPAMVASASTGIALWPAVMAAEQAPLHFAAAELRLASYQRR